MDLFSRFVPTLGFAVFRFVFGSSGSAGLYPKIPLPILPFLSSPFFKMKYCRLWISEAAETLLSFPSLPLSTQNDKYALELAPPWRSFPPPSH